MDNFAMTGNTVEFLRAYQNAVAAARSMGKIDPEKAVQNAFRSRDPEVRALTRRLTEPEKAEMYRAAGGLGPEMQESQRRYEMAAGLIGIGEERESATPAPRILRVTRRPVATTIRRRP
jgi:hypothetical protein